LLPVLYLCWADFDVQFRNFNFFHNVILTRFELAHLTGKTLEFVNQWTVIITNKQRIIVTKCQDEIY